MEVREAHPGWWGGHGKAVVAVALLCIAGLAAGCSRADDESSSGDAGSAEEAASVDGATDASGAGGAAGESTAVSADAVEVEAAEGRQRTFTANLSLGVDEVDRAVEQAAEAVSSVGGFTAYESRGVVGFRGAVRSTNR